jgi:DNA-binding MarR family transcriptional regulator
MDWSDEAAKAWQRAHPELDLKRLLPLLRLSEQARWLERFEREVLARFELAPNEFRVLATLHRGGHPEPDTATRIADRLGHTTGGMAKLLQRLETKQWIERVVDPEDRRAARVTLSPRGEALLLRSLHALAAAAEQRFAGLDAGAGEAIERALSLLEAALAGEPAHDSATGGALSDRSSGPARDRRRRSAPRTDRSPPR